MKNDPIRNTNPSDFNTETLELTEYFGQLAKGKMLSVIAYNQRLEVPRVEIPQIQEEQNQEIDFQELGAEFD